MAAQTFFVTGTDTGVGKTTVTVALLKALKDAHIQALGMKPIASGAVFDAEAGRLINDDARQLQAAGAHPVAWETLNPYVFEPAIAPHIAAQQAGQTIEVSCLAAALEQLEAQAEVVLVEGAGGWYTPLDATRTFADVVSALQLPVILVVGVRLGCLNHAILTMKAIAQSQTTLYAWVASVLEPDMPALTDNLAMLHQLIPAPCLGVLSFQGQASAQQTLEITALYES